MVFIHKGFVDVDGLGRDVGGEDPVISELLIVRGGAGPYQIRGDLSRLDLRGQLGQNLVGPRKEIFHGDVGIFRFKALFDGLDLLLLHGRK